MKCSGKRTNGQSCLMNAVPGTTRCHLHGGNHPVARIKAEEGMAHARMPAVEVLNTLLEQYFENPCPACGYPIKEDAEKRTIIKAAEAVLDRTGMPRRAVVELTPQSDGPLNLDLLTDEERGQLLALLAQVRDIKEKVKLRALGSPPPEKQVSGIRLP